MAAAVVDLRLSLSDWLRLTPAQFSRMYRLFEGRSREREWQMATLTAAVVNSGFSRPKEGVSPRDFMSRREGVTEIKPKRPRGRMTAKRREEVAAGIRGFFAQYMKKGPTASQ